MSLFFRSHHWVIFGALGLIVCAGILVVRVLFPTIPEYVTTTVERGAVTEVVAVSGVSSASQRVDLAFKTGGVVETVAVRKGDVVEAGQILLTLESRDLAANEQEAKANIASAVATRDELLAGPTATDRDVTADTILTKEAALAATIEREDRLVENARRTLNSIGLATYSDSPNEDAPAPVVSGTYTCSQTGTYKIEVYSSGSVSGYSYRLSGIENGTFSASVDQSVALGECGLRIRFTNGAKYSNSIWYIDIPNQKSTEYTTALNAYELAKTVAENNITLATIDLEAARVSAINSNAPARSEAVARANANISEASARLAGVTSDIADRSIVAPFSGTITSIDILPGEIVGGENLITLLTADAFEVTARAPEIDIGKLSLGQKVEMVFDAKSDEVVMGSITFISIQATEIDGVSYYEATIVPSSVPSWMRDGLNADVNIIFSEVTNSLKIPSRFLISSDSGFSVLKKSDAAIATTTIDVTLRGNDGFVAITGLTEGDTLVAP